MPCWCTEVETAAYMVVIGDGLAGLAGPVLVGPLFW